MTGVRKWLNTDISERNTSSKNKSKTLRREKLEKGFRDASKELAEILSASIPEVNFEISHDSMSIDDIGVNKKTLEEVIDSWSSRSTEKSGRIPDVRDKWRRVTLDFAIVVLNLTKVSPLQFIFNTEFMF